MKLMHQISIVDELRKQKTCKNWTVGRILLLILAISMICAGICMFVLIGEKRDNGIVYRPTWTTIVAALLIVIGGFIGLVLIVLIGIAGCTSRKQALLRTITKLSDDAIIDEDDESKKKWNELIDATTHNVLTDDMLQKLSEKDVLLLNRTYYDVMKKYSLHK